MGRAADPTSVVDAAAAHTVSGDRSVGGQGERDLRRSEELDRPVNGADVNDGETILASLIARRVVWG